MKPFNLEDAKAGKLVCTRDGKPARIICFDAKRENYPIITLIENNGNEIVVSHNLNGRFSNYQEENLDLFMVSEKHEGWINIFVKLDGYRYTDGVICDSFAEAVDLGKPFEDYLTTIKIEWKE